MYKIKIISVGKLKKSYWQEALAHYEKMMCTTVKIQAVQVKDCPRLQGEERKDQEAALITKKLKPKDQVWALHETGQLYSSPAFASMLRASWDNPAKNCCFVIGGALGLGHELLHRAHGLISLGPMTLPHELAHVVLYEQIFRATTILLGRTYHY